MLVVDQENRHNLGGQAFWSLGGLFFVDSPEQRRIGIKDSPELAWQDWMGSAQFDRLGDGTTAGRGEDHWPRQWAQAYVDFAAGEKRDYLHDLGLQVAARSSAGPSAATAARSATATRCPRFHLTWGTGPEVVRIFAEPVERGEAAGSSRFAFRHQVDELVVEDGAVVGVRGTVLAADDSERAA